MRAPMRSVVNYAASVAALLLILMPSMADSAANPNRAALLVLDMQVDFLSPNGRMPIAPGQIEPVLANSNRAIMAAATRHDEIVYIGNEYMRWDIPGNWFRHNAARAGTAGAALVPNLRRIDAAPYFPKRRGDAFSNPALARFLDAHHVRRLTIVGVYADACVTATARAAFRRGYTVTVLSDAVGAASENARRAALSNLEREGIRVEPTNAFTRRDGPHADTQAAN
jgi:nicotinamidase-related amidase